MRAGPSLTLAERAGLVNDTGALVRNGEMPAGDALALLPQFLRTPERHIIQGTMGTVREMNDLIPEALRPRYAQFIRRTYGAMAHRLGWSPGPGEGDETRLLRPGLLSLVAGPGEDPALIAEAGRLARRWLEDRQSLDPDLVGPVLEIAARNGDRALFDRFHAAARQTPDPMERVRLLRALGAFRDSTILQAVHHLALTDEFHPNEAIGLAFAGLGEPRTRPLAYEFVKQNFDALVARVPRNDAAALLYSVGGFADAKHRADAAAFFGPRAAKLPGGPRLLAQVLEQIRLNIALKRAQLPSLEAFLQRAHRYPGGATQPPQNLPCSSPGITR